MLVIFIPPALFCMFFAWPWSPDQPTEIWALARIRFFFKPRRRVWDQSGVKELVTITAPKKIEHSYTDGLSQTEVRSRLSALANTIDSRGWVVKNSLVNLSSGQYGAGADTSDRLVNYSNMPQEVSNVDIQASDDILDEQNSPIAQQFDQMIQASYKAHRNKLAEELRTGQITAAPALRPLNQQLTADQSVAPVDQPVQQQQPAAPPQFQPQPTQAQQPAAPAANLWFLDQPAGQTQATGSANNVVFADPTVIQAGTAPQNTLSPAEEAALAEKLKANQQQPSNQLSYSHLKNIRPLSEAELAQLAAGPPQPPPQPPPDPAILNLATNNDLNVATLAREANKAREPKQPPDDEVVISLH